MLWGIIRFGLIVYVIYKIITDPRWLYTIFHLPTVLSNLTVDLYRYVRYKEWNRLKDYGRMDVYIADERQPFGSGKTLNCVADTLAIYNRYNDVDVFNFDKADFVKQYVHIYSNIKLNNVPYVPLVSEQQIIRIANGEDAPKDDNEHVFIFLLDELGTIYNNRNWKDNLSPDFLAAFLQQRKHHVIFKGTVQDYSLFDATLRKTCTSVYSCSKKWRYLVLKEYYAKDIERAGFNTDLLAVRSLHCNFATDQVYNSYDTNEVVGKLLKEIEAGHHLSNAEIINLSENESNIETITRIGKRYRNKKKRGA